jgi:putative transposase
MSYPLVLDPCRQGDPCRGDLPGARFAQAGFYAWRQDRVRQRDWDEAHLVNAAVDIDADDLAFGYRFIAGELPARGITAGENKVARLCSQQRIWPAFSKKRGLACKAGPPVHDGLVARQFTAGGPDRTWLTGITEHPTAEGKLYLCAIKDVYSNRIAGYSMSARMTAALAVSALRNASALRSPAGTVVVHPDRGSQFRSAAFVTTLRSSGLTGSMGRAGACADTAAMESFSALLHKNVLDRQRWDSREQPRLATITWIERTYHRRRQQRRPGRLTPTEYQTINKIAHAA